MFEIEVEVELKAENGGAGEKKVVEKRDLRDWG